MFFVGFFGPIGVSAIFYLYLTVEFLRTVTVEGNGEGEQREDARKLEETVTVVVWFIAICSIVSFFPLTLPTLTPLTMPHCDSHGVMCLTKLLAVFLHKTL